jgi:Tfp pilus assembly protein PilF
MTNTAKAMEARPTADSQTKPARPRLLRWHPARLLYVFVLTLLVGIAYSEVQALLTDPASALDPSQLQHTFFWHLALAYPVYFAAASALAVGAAVLGWRLDRRYAAQQQERQQEATVAAVVERVQAEVRPAVAGLTVPHDLPPRAPGFVGRQQDLAQTEATLRQGQAVAIVGMGGLGKSSLAAEVVHALAAKPNLFPGGVSWVRCDERTGLDGTIWIEDQLLLAWGASLPAEATARAATAEEGLGLREQALRKRLGSQQASSAALVLLDNVEPDLPLSHLLDTLAPLGIATLVTTRVEPTSQHIRLLTLDVLDAEAGVRLFAERYADRGGAWDAARDTLAATAIVVALGGLPLAIELAAARAARTRLPLATLAEELRAPDALAKLNDPRDPSAGVRYSLRKTLLTLTPSQRARFAALGLPDGPDWALPIIERMFEGAPAEQSGVAPARDDLEALVAYSVVSLSTTEGIDTPRVRLHPLVRELAREEWAHLPDAEQKAALHALLAGVQDWVAQHPASNVDPAAFARNSQVLAVDVDLIAGALRTAMAHQQDLPQVIGIAEAWETYLYVNPPLARDMSRLRLESARALSDRQAEMLALEALARVGQFTGSIDELSAYRQAALAIARELGDQPRILALLGFLGEDAALRGDSADAERMYAEVSSIAGEMGDQLTDSSALNGLGAFAYGLGHLGEAEQWFRRSLASAEADGNLFQIGSTLTNLGFVYARMGDTAAAQLIHEELLQSTRAFGTTVGLAVQLNALGQLALWAGNLQTASQYLREALQTLEQVGATDVAGAVRGNLAIARGMEAMRQGDQAGAEDTFDEALRLFEMDTLPCVDQRPFIRQLLAELRDPSVANAGALAKVSPEVSAEHIRYVRQVLAFAQGMTA